MEAASTPKPNHIAFFHLPSGLFPKLLFVLFVGFSAWIYQAIQPPPPKLYGSPGGPSVTGSRIELRDGRHLAYKELGVPRDAAKHKIIYVHPFGSSRLDPLLEKLSPEIVEAFGVYLVSFDRPGYGESDPHPSGPSRTLKSLTEDIEELADQLGLGPKFYLIGYSMGGVFTWSCLKYIPHRLAGVSLLTPVINYWWPGFPAHLSKQAYREMLPRDQWAVRVCHYAPWLVYWSHTQKIFPGSSVTANSPDVLSKQDKEISASFYRELLSNRGYARQQGDAESILRDAVIGFGKWEFDPMDLDNPFPDNQGNVHLWQGDEDMIVPVKLQRHIAQRLRLPWIRYHELSGSGHLFPVIDGMFDEIVKVMLTGE